jgi:hypothetical protein
VTVARPPARATLKAMRTLALPLLAAALLAACGSETPAKAPARTDLLVRVDQDGPKGGQPAKSTHVRCPGAHCKATKGLKPRDFAPTPTGIACSMIFGGPETASVKGTLDGQPVHARFSRTDGCQTSRWRKVQRLLAAAS